MMEPFARLRCQADGVAIASSRGSTQMPISSRFSMPSFTLRPCTVDPRQCFEPSEIW
jgi:hypothetical protein